MAASEKQREALQRARNARAEKAAEAKMNTDKEISTPTPLGVAKEFTPTLPIGVAKEEASTLTLTGLPTGYDMSKHQTMPSAFHLENTSKRSSTIITPVPMSDEEVWMRAFCAAIVSRDVKSHTQLDEVVEISNATLVEFKKRFK